MEQLWNRGGATGGKRSARGTPENGLNWRQTVATGCHQLPFGSHGKEWVDGSSPEEGSYESPAKAILLLFLCTALRPACLGVEQVLEQPDESGRDFVVWPGIRVGREARLVGLWRTQNAERPKSYGTWSARLCKPEVTGSIPVRSIAARSPAPRFARDHVDFDRLSFRFRRERPTPAKPASVTARLYAVARARRWLKRSILSPLTAACSRPV